MTQPGLPFADYWRPHAPRPGLTCAHGAPWVPGHPCAACDAFTAAARRQFAADVAAGIYDAQGFTARDRRAQAKKRAQG